MTVPFSFEKSNKTVLFGKRQANIGSAILQNYERAQEIYETSLNSDGSATAENAKYLESVQGHLDQLMAKWESFSVTIANSDGLKAFIDIGGGIVSVLETLTNTFGSATMVALPFIGALSKLGNFGRLQYAPLRREQTSRRVMAA